MRRALTTLAILAVLAVAVLFGARAAGLGPLAAAPSDRLYIAVSRTADENAAREIEVVDLSTGERSGFDPGTRVGTISLSPDRRTLYVGGIEGRVSVLDAGNGSYLRALDSGRPVQQLLGLADDRVMVVTGGATMSATIWDAKRGRVLLSRDFVASATGRPALRGTEIAVPIVETDPPGTAVLAFDVGTLQPRRIPIARSAGLAGRPAAATRADGKVAVLTGFDPRTGSARLILDADDRTRELALSTSGSPSALVRQLRVDLIAAGDGSLHACVSDGQSAARYRIATPFERAERVGAECGSFARAGDAMFLGLRGRPQVLALDAAGRVTRTLLLPGIGVAIGP